MTIERTSHLSGLASVDALDAAAAGAAQTVAAYSRPGADGTSTVVIEVSDAYRNLLARSVIDTAADRETAADFVLVDSPIERCGTWRIDPIHKHRRIVAMVSLRASETTSDFERLRAGARTA